MDRQGQWERKQEAIRRKELNGLCKRLAQAKTKRERTRLLKLIRDRQGVG